MEAMNPTNIVNTQYDKITMTTSTMTTRPISSPALSPRLSPKRKCFDTECLEQISSKKPRLSLTETTEETPNSPLYKNFGNGLSLCNNTKTTNRFANIDEVLQYLSYDETTITKYNNDDINEKTLSEDVLNEFIDNLHDTKELPELNLNLWDLRDMLRLDLDLL